MAKRVSLGADVDISKQGERLDATTLVKGVVGHVDIALTNHLTLHAAKMDGLLLPVMHDINDREPVHGEQMFICSAGSWSQLGSPLHMPVWKRLTPNSSRGRTMPTNATSHLPIGNVIGRSHPNKRKRKLKG